MNTRNACFLMSVVVLVCAPFVAYAQQIAPNPNAGIIDITGFAVNNQSFTNLQTGVLQTSPTGILENMNLIDNQGLLDNSGTLNNVHNLYNNGWLYNNGLMNNNDMINNGSIYNGSLNNNAVLNSNILFNYGGLENHSTLYNDITLKNYGTLTNYFGTLVNNGELTNYGYMRSYGTLNNNGNLTSSDNLNNYGTLNNFGVLNNTGTLQNDGNLVIFNTGKLLNYSTLLNTGTVRNEGSIDGNGVYQQSLGQTQTIINGYMRQSVFDFGGGLLAGTGNLVAGFSWVNIYSGATVNPGDPQGTGLGTLVIAGYTNADNFVSSGTLIFEIGGLNAGLFDVLGILGSGYSYGGARFTGGTVEFDFINGFHAMAGNYWDFLLADTITGWDKLSFTMMGLDAGLGWEIIDVAHGKRLMITGGGTPVPEPSTFALLAAGALALLGWTRKRKEG